MIENMEKESHHRQLLALCGDLSLLQSAALMKRAKMNFVNDSGFTVSYNVYRTNALNAFSDVSKLSFNL
jgi:hypothetical protein